MPPARPRRSDARLLLGATVAILLGGIVIAAAILAITSGEGVPNVRRPQPFGLASDIKTKVREGGPINFPGLSGDDGFWAAIEDGQIVALLVRQPAPASCTLRWRGSRDTFTCDDRPVEVANLARYRNFVQATGNTKGLLMVELTKVIPPPSGPPPTTSTTPTAP